MSDLEKGYHKQKQDRKAKNVLSKDETTGVLIATSVVALILSAVAIGLTGYLSDKISGDDVGRLNRVDLRKGATADSLRIDDAYADTLVTSRHAANEMVANVSIIPPRIAKQKTNIVYYKGGMLIVPEQSQVNTIIVPASAKDGTIVSVLNLRATGVAMKIEGVSNAPVAIGSQKFKFMIVYKSSLYDSSV